MILCTPRPINKRFLQNTFLFTVARDLCITLDLHFSTLIDCAAVGRGGASPIPNFVNLQFPTRATLTQYLFKSNAIRNSLGRSWALWKSRNYSWCRSRQGDYCDRALAWFEWTGWGREEMCQHLDNADIYPLYKKKKKVRTNISFCIFP